MATKQTLSDQLRAAIESCGKTRYRISQETKIAQSILSRFLHQGAGLSLENVDKLCECIGAELTMPAKPKTKSKTKGN